MQEQTTPKKKRSEQYKKQKRKWYRQNKKCSLYKSWEEMAVEAMQQRCRERIAKSRAIEAAELEEKRKKVEEEKLRLLKLREIKALKTAQCEREVEQVEKFYNKLSHKERLYITVTA